MRIVIVGATGSVGKTAVAALADRHEIIGVGRTSGDVHMDVEDVHSIRAMYRKVGRVDAVVSAVGHEVDVTIADLVADERAATPSSAAERVVPDGQELRRQLLRAARRLAGAAEGVLEDQRRRTDDLAASLEAGVTALLERRALRLARAMDKLEALSPLAALKRGYAVAQDEDGRLLRRVADYEELDRFRLRVADGRVYCTVEGTEADE